MAAERKPDGDLTPKVQKAFERAVATLLRECGAGTYGVVSFHLQGGLVVRLERRTTEAFKDT